MLADVEQGIAIQTFNTTNEMFEKSVSGKEIIYREYITALHFESAVFFAAKVKLVKLILTFTTSRAIMQVWCYK